MSAPVVTVRPVQVLIEERMTSLDDTTGIFVDDVYIGLTWHRQEAYRFARDLLSLPVAEVEALREAHVDDSNLVAVGVQVLLRDSAADVDLLARARALWPGLTLTSSTRPYVTRWTARARARHGHLDVGYGDDANGALESAITYAAGKGKRLSEMLRQQAEQRPSSGGAA